MTTTPDETPAPPAGEPGPVYPNGCTDTQPAELDAQRRLLALLGLARFQLLADALEEITSTTRYGDVKIVVADGHVVRIKVEKSY